MGMCISLDIPSPPVPTSPKPNTMDWYRVFEEFNRIALYEFSVLRGDMEEERIRELYRLWELRYPDGKRVMEVNNFRALYSIRKCFREAARMGNLRLMRFMWTTLINSKGERIFESKETFNEALSYATMRGHIEIIEFINSIGKMPKMDYLINVCISLATTFGQDDTLRYFCNILRSQPEGLNVLEPRIDHLTNCYEKADSNAKRRTYNFYKEIGKLSLIGEI